MTLKAAKWTLWLTLLLTLPVPYWMVEIGWVPVARLSAFAVFVAAAAVTEPDGTSIMISAFFAVQALAYGAALYGLARLGSRWLQRVAPRQLRAVIMAALISLLFVASLFNIFRTPLSGHAQHGNLLALFD